MKTLRIALETDYNKNLQKTISGLHAIHNELLGQVVNLAISGDLYAVYKDVGEQGINFKYGDFTNLSDNNVQHLIELIELVKDKIKILNKALH